MTIADQYVEFGSREARGNSPTYERLSANVLALDGKPLAWVRGHGQALRKI